MNAWLKEAPEEYGEQWNEKYGSWTVGAEYTKAISNATERIEQGEDIRLVQNLLREDIQGVDQDCWEWVYDIGKVPSARLIFCLAAIRKLWSILEPAINEEELDE